MSEHEPRAQKRSKDRIKINNTEALDQHWSQKRQDFEKPVRQSNSGQARQEDRLDFYGKWSPW